MARLRDLLGRFKAKPEASLVTLAALLENDKIANTTPEGFVDFVVRITHPTRRMRTMTIRTTSEDLAIEAVITSLQGADLTGWSLLDVATVEDAQRRAEGRR